MPGKSTSRLGQCTLATGNVVAGQVLYRFIFWDTQAKQHYVHRGQSWIVGTATEWCNDIGISAKQFERAMSLLKRGGFIDVCYRGHPRQTQILRCSWVRTTAKTKAVYNPQKGGTNHPQTGVTNHPQNGVITYTGELLGELNPADAGKNSGGEVVNLEEKIAEMKKQKTALPKADAGPKHMAMWFKGLLAEEYGGFDTDFFIQDLSGQEIGNIKKMLTEMPQMQLIATMEKAVRDWAGFCTFIEDTAGAFNLPDIPKIGVLFKYRSEMVLYEKHGIDDEDLEDLLKGV